MPVAKTKKKEMIKEEETMENVMLLLGKVVSEKAKHHKIETVTEYSAETNKIILPVGMSKKKAADDLMLQWNNEEQEQAFQTELTGWEWKDGLRAFRNVLEEKFGWIKGVETWFSTPTEIDIVTNIVDGSSTTEKAFIGKVAFPAWEEAQGQVGVNGAGVVVVHIKAKRKFSTAITQFFADLRNYLNTQSMYRGKAVVVSKVLVPGGAHTIDLQITEIIPNQKIFLNSDEELTVDNFVIGDLNESGKRCYLFTGTYGNGKTETAMRVGKAALAKGISFFYIKNADLLVEALAFAKNYEPCVIFLEDVDETAAGTDRDERMNQILNTLDGVQTKGRDIKVIFTTNHEKRINAALRRPGRIDLIVHFSNPKGVTVEKIYRSHLDRFKGSEDIDYKLVLEETPDAQGAVIAEIAMRATKLAKKNGFITTDFVRAAQASMKHQIEFMREEVDAVDPLKKSLETMKNYFNTDMKEVKELVESIDSRV